MKIYLRNNLPNKALTFKFHDIYISLRILHAGSAFTYRYLVSVASVSVKLQNTTDVLPVVAMFITFAKQKVFSQYAQQPECITVKQI